MLIGAYPGTFDPPTVAHLAVAEAALSQGGLDELHLVVSRAPLGKSPAVPSLDDRLAVLEEVASSRPWLAVRVTDRRLITEVAEGYGAVVMGTDKWLQVIDPSWYGGAVDGRDAAVRALPVVLLAVREGSEVPPDLPDGVKVLDVHPAHGPVSSTLVRAGRSEWMLAEAARFDALTGAWSDPSRYLATRAATTPGDARNGPPVPASLPPMPDRDQPRG